MKRGVSRGLFLASVAAVGVLAVRPATSWIVRQKFQAIGGAHSPTFHALDDTFPEFAKPRKVAAATTYPQDFERQRAMALEQEDDSTEESSTHAPIVRALVALQPQFGDRPELQADILRFMTARELEIPHKNDEQILYTPEEQAVLKSEANESTHPTTPAALTLAEQIAQRGESLDPDNAYFPAMRTVALYAQHRDTDAFAALEDAAKKTRWDDYSSGEVRARWALLHAAYGETGALPRIAVQSSLFFPHYPRLRDMARLTTALAVRREMSGDVDGGFRLRRSLARVGGLMRAQSSFLVGNLVGAAIVKLSCARPGGAPALKDEIVSSSKIVGDSRYTNYLTAIGHPEEARRYAWERQAYFDIRSLTDGVVMPNDVESIGALTSVWSLGILLLMSALGMLTLGGIATALSRTRRIRASKPLQLRGRRAGVFGAILIVGWLGVIGALYTSLVNYDANALLTAVAATVIAGGLLVLPVRRLRRGQTRGAVVREIVRSAGVIAVCLLPFAVLLGLTMLACLGIDGALGGLFDFSIMGEGNPGESLEFRLMVATAVLALPLFAMLLIAIWSRIRRVPVTVGIVRGMRGVTLPLAALLLFGYAAAVLLTAQREAAMRVSMDANLVNEGQHCAALAHRIWPGLVPLNGTEGKP